MKVWPGITLLRTGFYEHSYAPSYSTKARTFLTICMTVFMRRTLLHGVSYKSLQRLIYTNCKLRITKLLNTDSVRGVGRGCKIKGKEFS